jgi:hypothetical protein
MKVAFVWRRARNSAYGFDKTKLEFDLSYLLMFRTRSESNAGSVSSLKLECERFGVPLFWAKLDSERPEEYLEVVAELKEDFGVEAIVMDGAQDVIEESCRAVGMKVIRT